VRAFLLSALFVSGFFHSAAQTESAVAPVDSPSVAPPEALRSKVHYKAQDSIALSPDLNRAYLYNQAVVEYEQISLKAGFVRLDWKTDEAFAKGIRDSSGAVVQRPLFTQDGKEYLSDSIRYNFNTKKARIYRIITQEGEGYLHGDQVKKIDDKVFYLTGGSYTTCNLEHPHFSLRTNRTKVIGGDQIVTGPAHLEVLDIPTPIILPFGFFPTTERRHSGILIPTWGNNLERGYFLKDGGYYWAVNDYFDLTFRADIYSMGGFGLNTSSNYRRRYRHSGSFLLSFNRIIIGKPSYELIGGRYQNSTDFNITWNHAQDPKARPDLRFSSSVNIATNSYFQNTQQQAQQVLTSQLRSNVAINKSWTGRPYSLSANLEHSQNIQTGDLSLTLPRLAFNLQRIQPFAPGGKALGGGPWYEDIGFTYSANAENRIRANTLEDDFDFSELWGKSNYGLRQSMDVSTSLKIFRYWSLTPNFSASNRTYPYKLSSRWDADSQVVIVDTTYGFYNAFDFNAAASLSTKIYGQYNYRGKVRALRHVVSPNIRFSYQPDFSDPFWGYYETYQNQPNGSTVTQSVFRQGIYGSPSQGLQANLGLGIDNTLEMKVRSKRDSTGLAKIRLLEGFGLNTSYNAAATSFAWAPLSLNARTRILKELIGFQFNASFDFYGVDLNGQRVNRSAREVNGVWLRNTGSSFNVDIKLNDAILSGKTPAQNSQASNPADAQGLGLEQGNFDYYGINGFMDFALPWNARISYNQRISKNGLNTTLTRSMRFNGDFQLTEAWRVSFDSGYDLERRQITQTSISIDRDLHCWQLRVLWVPFGFQKSYSIGFNAKASILKDAKVERRRGIGDFE